MVSPSLVSAVVAASLLSMATAQLTSSSSSILSIPTPTATMPLAAMSTIGCFESGTPLEDHGEWKFQTVGNCQPICVGLGMPVMALADGTNCWCGKQIPPKDSQVDNSTCDTPCSGFDKATCGGPQKWWVLLTGITKNRIEHYDPKSSSSQLSTSAQPVSTIAPSTIVVGPTAIPSATESVEPPSSGGGGPNKVGIAVGVVVGVLALAAIVGGVLFYLRNRRRREIEEEYRRQAAVNSFVAGNKLHTSNSSMTDSRLDPEFMMRRQSNGSIADNEDYSRRILQVTNPDGR